MNIPAFADLLDRRGTDLRRWPWHRRMPARRLLACSAAARAVYEQAVAMESALHEALTPPPLPPALRARLLAGAAAVTGARASAGRPVAPARRGLPWRGAWIAAAAGACGLGGFLVGAAGVLGTPEASLLAALAGGLPAGMM